MTKEKYLEDAGGAQWRITPLGRQVAQGSVKVTAGAWCDRAGPRRRWVESAH